MKQACVYILASRSSGTLYIGVTSNRVQRIWQHKPHLIEGFTARYNVSKLVWFEAHDSMYSALQREKHIKEWRRQWKIDLIATTNPQWRDLYDDIIPGREVKMDSGLRRNDE